MIITNHAQQRWDGRFGYRVDNDISQEFNQAIKVKHNYVRSLNIKTVNTRKVRLFKYKGKDHTLRELSEMSGVKLNTMKTRLTNLGWSVERAMGDVK